MFTRRDTTKLLLGSVAALALPTGLAAASRDEWLGAMQGALRSATAPNAGTELGLVSFDFDRKGPGANMVAVVHMDWTRGVRRRVFAASEGSERETFMRLVGTVVSEYRRVNPAGVREVRFSN